MAKANQITEVVKIPVTTYREETKVTGIQLNLSMAEAKALKQLLGRLSGSPDNSIRKYTDGICNSLDDLVDLRIPIREVLVSNDVRTWPEGQDPFKD